MGTSGAYSGGGGKPGRDLREAIKKWVSDRPRPKNPHSGQSGSSQRPPPVSALSHGLGLFRSRGASGTGAGAGGAQRTTANSARSAGRAAAAAYAFRTGNRSVLSDLGLDYSELRSLDDPLEVSRKIVEAACGMRSESTIDHEEQRWVAAEIAEWVLSEREAGDVPQPDEIVRKSVALIVFEAVASEVGELISSGGYSEWSDLDREMQDAADVLSQESQFSIGGATNAEFAAAIEEGIEALREIYVAAG